jgi:tetratricopeptide (TPR) repeat protein
MNLNEVQAAWYANLGAVPMAKVELAGFPTNRWTSPSVLPDLQQAESTLQAALQSNPANYTANYRLGLISMLRQDFISAAAYLEKANQVVPDHRGIVKSLGYCYAWLGDIEKASLLLDEIPEADNELKVYIWWWETQGRNDLSTNASLVLDTFDASAGQP